MSSAAWMGLINVADKRSGRFDFFEIDRLCGEGKFEFCSVEFIFECEVHLLQVGELSRLKVALPPMDHLQVQ